MINYTLNRKDTIIRLITGWIKKDIVCMCEHFQEPKSIGANVKVDLICIIMQHKQI